MCELYQQLHTAELPHCLSQFETIIFETIKDIKQQQAETTRLEQSLKRLVFLCYFNRTTISCLNSIGTKLISIHAIMTNNNLSTNVYKQKVFATDYKFQ